MTYETILKELVDNDDRVVIMTAENRAAIRNLPSQIGEKFIDTGITEQTMIGMAAGLALRGRIPVAHALASFLTMRAFEFIRTDVGIGNLPVKLIGGFSGFLSEANGPTHQAIEDIAILRSIPNVNIFCPADEDDMLIGLKQIILSESPFYVRYNNLKSIYKHSKEFEIGKAEIVGDGNDVSIIVYGMLFSEAYKAMELLKKSGVNAAIINLRTIKPVDENALLDASNSRLVVTLEDHFLTGGLYSILSELLVKNKITANVLPLSLENKWFKPALLNDVLEYEKFTAAHISEKIINKLNA